MKSAPEGVIVQARITEELEDVPTIEQTTEELTCFDTLSTISADSVSVLNPSQRQDIIKKFTEAVLKNMPSTCTIPDDLDSQVIPFRQRFEPLLKIYSKEVQKDTHQKSQKQAAKQIRKLRYDISGKCEEAFKGVGTTVKDHRIYPNIIKEAEKVNTPEMTWEEKVNDWVPEDILEFKPLIRGFEAIPSIQSSTSAEYHVKMYNTSDVHSETYQLSLSQFDRDTITSDGIDADIIHIGATEDREIYQYLTTHIAFQNLVSKALKLIKRYYSNQMGLIRHRVLLGLGRPLTFGIPALDRQRAIFHIDWNIPDFLRDKYASGITQDLGCILAITGQAKNAHLSTVRSYLNLMWPKNPSSLLGAIQSAINKYSQLSTPFSPPPATLSEDQNGRISVDLETQTITVNGAEDLIVTVAQQLGWLVSACRASPTADLAHSFVSFTEDESLLSSHIPTFQVACEISSISPEEFIPGTCWNEVVGNSVIAASFPIPERSHDEVGLEIPLDIMAGLGGVPVATQYAGGFVLKGRSVIFVPVERRADSVLWHFIRKDRGRIRYSDVASLCKMKRLSVGELNEKDLRSTRAFLGWCKSSVNNLATNYISYENVGYSKTNKSSRLMVNITGGSVGFSYFATGTVTYSIGKHNGPYTAERSNFYEDILDDARQIHVVLQDMEQRRAWQTNAERAILHIIMHRQAKVTYKVDGSIVELQTADPGDPSSVRKAMLDNATRIITHDQCMKENMVQAKLFKDVVGELYYIFEGLEAKSDEISTEGIKLGLDWRKHTQGYEYMELVQRKHRVQIKEAELRKTCGNWPDYARDISAVILFGTNFGEVFKPSNTAHLCQAMKQAPTQKDYLIVELSALSDLYTEHGCHEDQSQITATGMRWHRSQHIFESCERHKSRGREVVCKCQRIQQFVPKEYSGSVTLPGALHDSGAVIFGLGKAYWMSGFAKSLSKILESEPEESKLDANSPAPLTSKQHHPTTGYVPLTKWESKIQATGHSTESYRSHAVPKDGALKPAIPRLRDKTLIPTSVPQNSIRQRPQCSSSYSDNSSSISNRETSAGTDSGYVTQSTSTYAALNIKQAKQISLAVHEESKPNALYNAYPINEKQPLSTAGSSRSTSHYEQKNASLPYSEVVKTKMCRSERSVRETQPTMLHPIESIQGSVTIRTISKPKEDALQEAWRDKTRQNPKSYLQRDLDLRPALVPSPPSQPKLSTQQYPGLRRKPNFGSLSDMNTRS